MTPRDHIPGFASLQAIKLGLFFLLMMLCIERASAQDIPFGQYGSYTLMVDILPPAELDFGTIITGSGENSVNLGDPEMLTIQVTAVRYLDIFVTITPPVGDVIVFNGDPAHQGNPSRSIPVTLFAAYANRGIDDPSTARIMSGLFGLFPVFQRQAGPPGPPPVPPHAGYVPDLETAYIYLYGSLNVGDIDAGPYSGEVVISIEYN